MEKNPHNIQLKNDYMRYNKQLSKIINEAKNKYEQNIFSKNANNPRVLWNSINNKLGKNVNKVNKVEYLIDDSNNKITNPLSIANHFNEFYCKVGRNLSEKIKKRRLPNPSKIIQNEKSMFLYATNIFEINNTIVKLKNKAGRVDNINEKR